MSIEKTFLEKLQEGLEKLSKVMKCPTSISYDTENKIWKIGAKIKFDTYGHIEMKKDISEKEILEEIHKDIFTTLEDERTKVESTFTLAQTQKDKFYKIYNEMQAEKIEGFIDHDFSPDTLTWQYT